MGKSWAVYCLIRYISYMMIWSFYLLSFVMIWSFYWLSFVIWFDLFQCRISGKPAPAVKWVLNGRIISNLSSPPHASRWHPFQSQEFEKKFKHPGGFNFFWNSLLEVQGSSSHQVVSTSFELLWTDFVNISNASICLQPPGEALQHQGGRNCCR